MANLPLVNEDYTMVGIMQSGGMPPPDPKGTFLFSANPTSPNCKATGKKLHITSFAWTVPPGSCIMAGAVHTSGGGSISADTSKCKADTQKCFKQFVKGSCNGIFTLPAPPGATLPCSCQIMIPNAGQIKVLGS